MKSIALTMLAAAVLSLSACKDKAGDLQNNVEKVGDNHFEMNTASANAGARWQAGAHSASGAVTYLENNVGGQRLDEQLGVYGQYTYQVNPNDEAGFFAQWLDQKHPVSRALDTRLKLLGAGWRHGFEGPGTPVLSLAAYYGNDQAQGTDPSVGRRLVGGRIGYDRTLALGPRLLSGIARHWRKHLLPDYEERYPHGCVRRARVHAGEGLDRHAAICAHAQRVEHPGRRFHPAPVPRDRAQGLLLRGSPC